MKEKPPDFPHCPLEPGIFQSIYLSLEDEKFSTLSKFLIGFIMLLIFVSVFTFILETIPSLSDDPFFFYIEYFLSGVFTIEYAAKFISCRNQWRFFWDVMSLIDFLAIVPFWLEI